MHAGEIGSSVASCPGRTGQNLVIEALPAGLVLLNDLRIVTVIAVMGRINRALAKIALENFLAATVAGIAAAADRPIFLVT